MRCAKMMQDLCGICPKHEGRKSRTLQDVPRYHSQRLRSSLLKRNSCILNVFSRIFEAQTTGGTARLHGFFCAIVARLGPAVDG